MNLGSSAAGLAASTDKHSYCFGAVEFGGSQQKRTQPTCTRLAQTGAGHGSLWPCFAQKIVLEAKRMACAHILPITVESSICRLAPGEAGSAPAKAAAYGSPASTMLLQMRAEQVEGIAIGPLTTRLRHRVIAGAEPDPVTLGVPGKTGSP